jgi:predicted secreted Zn-dependent protease
MQEAQISTGIVTSMPHWVDFERGSSSLKEEWVKFYNALLDHENGHSEALVDLTDDNEAIVLNSSGCETANEQIHANHSNYRDKNLQYDADTDHGRTQGADASILLGK